MPHTGLPSDTFPISGSESVSICEKQKASDDLILGKLNLLDASYLSHSFINKIKGIFSFFMCAGLSATLNMCRCCLQE